VCVCANVRQATGLCDAAAIPGDLIEGQVLAHLDGFVGDAQTWLARQGRRARRRPPELLQASHRLREDLAAVDRRRGPVLADYERAVEVGDPNARIVLEVVAKLDGERDTLAQRIADTEAVTAEWEDSDDDSLADTVDLLRALAQADTVDLLRTLAQADTAEALNRAMATALTRHPRRHQRRQAAGRVRPLGPGGQLGAGAAAVEE
jgi:hypothetical protein